MVSTNGANALRTAQTETHMNWLTEYFAQATPTLNLTIWAFQPAVLGPDGPIIEPVIALPYPGIELAYCAADEVRRGDRVYGLPARYESAAPASAASSAKVITGATEFFHEISIYAASPINREPVIVINRNFSFAPVFAADGTPGFVGQSMPMSDDRQPRNQMKLPWVFAGYVSI
jgi:hypothetical protein